MHQQRPFAWLPVFFLLTFILVSCEQETKKPEKTMDTPEKKSVTIPRFERDSAFSFVEKQVDFGPRVPNTDAHRECRDWLAGKLRAYGAEVILQDFQATAYTGTTLESTNIIGQFNPENSQRILLAAHWDSRHIADSELSTERRDEPIAGADDGASGVGVLLEVARQLRENPIDLGVDIIFFDAEDHGQHLAEARDATAEMQSMETWCLGSQYWSRNTHYSGVSPKYGILLDMVGAKNARFPKEGFSMQMAPQIVEKVWKLAGSMGYGNYFVNDRANSITDDHYFVGKIAQIPMINIIHLSADSERTFGAHWHTHADDLEVIDPRTLRAVGQVVLAVIYRESINQF